MASHANTSIPYSEASEHVYHSYSGSKNEATYVPSFESADNDSDEEELERVVLGNRAGFRERLCRNEGFAEDHHGKDGELGEAQSMEDVDDADLFILDAGAGGSMTKPVTLSLQTGQKNASAWEDSDDDRLVVSLSSTSKLRRLRITQEDESISGTEYSKRLRQQYLRVNPAPAWAEEANDRPGKRRRHSSASSGFSSDDADGETSAQPLEEFLKNIKQLGGQVASKKRKLRLEVIDIQRTRDISDTHKTSVECLSFHPEYPVLLSASTASILYLHHIAPEAQPTPNPRLTSVQVKQVDVRQAQFLYPAGDKVFFAGRRKYYHHWDLPSGVVQKTTKINGHSLEKSMEHFKLSQCGRYMGIIASTRKGGGVINILNVASTQWIAAARLSSRHGIADFAWWKTGNGMTILGKDGQIGEYSMNSKAFIGIWHDDGCVGGIAVAVGGHGGPSAIGEDRWVAVGSNSGITNIYDRSTLIEPPQTESALVFKERPTPTRTFDQLITPITVIAFSPDGQLLAFGSRNKKDALRLAHLPSCTVYRNWPTEQTPLGRITTVAFGRQSDLLAVGNDAGKIRLWHIRS